MTIDVEMLRTVVAEKGYEALTTEELAELLDAYEERDRLRVMLERLRNRMAEPDQPIIQWDAGTWIPRIDAALEGRE